MVLSDFLIDSKTSVKSALKRLDETAKKVLLIVDEKQRLLGALSDGDIRRYILQNKSIDGPIEGVYNRTPIFLKKKEFTQARAKKLFIGSQVVLIPVVDEDGVVVDIVTWEKVFAEGTRDIVISRRINVPVVIMAGGKGTRLEPFTRILPKALIPIGDKTILEVIIDEFRRFGVNHYHLVVNHKGEMIEAFLKGSERDYKVDFAWEKEFLGTAGGLALLKDVLDETFIVSNCDIIVKANYAEVLDFHQTHGASMTLVSSIQHYKIPYGVVNFVDGGEVREIIEKPEYTFTINTGVYVLNKECLNYIPPATRFEMTHLIDALIAAGKRVMTYPVNEKDYVDIGQWEEYKNARERLSGL